VDCVRSSEAFCYSPKLARRRKRPKLPHQPKGKAPTAAIGLGLMLTRAKIAKLKALAAADLRSVPNYVVWLVASDLEKPPRRRGARAEDGADPPIAASDSL